MKRFFSVLLVILLLFPSGCSFWQELVGGPSSTAQSSSSVTSSGSQSKLPVESHSSASVAGSVPSLTSSRSSTVRVTVKEGMALSQVFELLEQEGVCSAEKLFSTAESYDYTYYPLVAAINSDKNRCFLLEGYLFPDTYEFYYGQKPQDVIGKFLRNAEAKLTESMRTRAAELGLSVDEILTVASIIEKECGKKSEMKTVSSVLHNRLSDGMKLQCDVTILYVERYIKPFIDGDVNRYNEYYNTYKCEALPRGPICNPGISAINAALYPEETEYRYFAANSDGEYAYASTYEGHMENLDSLGIG